MQAAGRYVDASAVRMKRVEECIARYTEASDARMKRVEENLDTLIRAITAEHSNGKP